MSQKLRNVGVRPRASEILLARRLRTEAPEDVGMRDEREGETSEEREVAGASRVGTLRARITLSVRARPQIG